MKRGRRTESEFPATSWTLLASACKDGATGEVALRDFAAQYYGPVHAYLSAIFHKDEEEVLDLTHAFFSSKILTRNILVRAEKGKGRFRHYLKQALRNFVKDHHRSQQRIVARDVPLEEARVVDDAAGDMWEEVERGYNVEYVRGLLERALEHVKNLCRQKDLELHLKIFQARYWSDRDHPPPWTEIGEQFGLDQKTARHRAETVVRHFRESLRMVLVEETGSEEQADDELSTLLALL